MHELCMNSCPCLASSSNPSKVNHKFANKLKEEKHTLHSCLVVYLISFLLYDSDLVCVQQRFSVHTMVSCKAIL